MNFKTAYGLSKPYDFHRALPFLLGLLFSLLMALAGAWLWQRGNIRLATYRFDFMLYLLALAGAGTLLAIRPRLAWFSLGLFFIEASLAILSQVLSGFGLAAPLLPVNLLPPHQRFSYHPTLQAVPTPNFSGHIDFGLYVDHNRLGLRGRNSDLENLEHRKLIAVYGGSTTYDVGSSTGNTWPEKLNEQLGKDYAVLNYGVLGYSTAENLIQTAFYARLAGKAPHCAVYYIGWNDIRNAHLPQLDPGYADFHLLSQHSNLRSRKTYLLAEISPLGKLIYQNLRPLFDTVPEPPSYRRPAEIPATAPELEAIFRQNLRNLVALNRAQGTRSVFIAQVYNAPRLKDRNANTWMPMVDIKYVDALQQQYNRILMDEARQLGIVGIDLANRGYQEADFVDNVHFSPAGSAHFAQDIAAPLRTACP
ncbi:MAG: hypothetical protein RIR00_1433 [Pseudomonadota bacterium]